MRFHRGAGRGEKPAPAVTLLRRLEESHQKPAALSAVAPNNICRRATKGSLAIARFRLLLRRSGRVPRQRIKADASNVSRNREEIGATPAKKVSAPAVTSEGTGWSKVGRVTQRRKQNEDASDYCIRGITGICGHQAALSRGRCQLNPGIRYGLDLRRCCDGHLGYAHGRALPGERAAGARFSCVSMERFSESRRGHVHRNDQDRRISKLRPALDLPGTCARCAYAEAGLTTAHSFDRDRPNRSHATLNSSRYWRTKL